MDIPSPSSTKLRVNEHRYSSAEAMAGQAWWWAGADSFKIGGHTALLFRLCVTEESIQIQGACIHRDR
jgi:hypothetical protein